MDRIGVEGRSVGPRHRHNRDRMRLFGRSAVVAGLTLAIQRPLASTDETTYLCDRLPVHIHLALSAAKALYLRSRRLRSRWSKVYGSWCALGRRPAPPCR
jgi:hypothetical protein